MKTALLAAAGLMFAICLGCTPAGPAPLDEAKAAGKSAGDFPTATYDYFREMDMTFDRGKGQPLPLTVDQIRGRNTWIMWCGGNEAFWDWLGNHSYGFLDLLKLVASPDAKTGAIKRANRFKEAGLINEPGFRAADDKDEFGLFLEVPVDPGIRKPREEVYGKSSGVMGLRLFRNPKFDRDAKSRWDAVRYFNDSSYFGDPELVRPYRVGMSCGFCHIGPHPLNPPDRPEEPKWSNLSSNIGSQYFRTRAVFGGLLKPDSFIYHVLDSQPPGTIDTSLVASDNINNPNTMNAVFGVPARLDRAGISLHSDKKWLSENPDRSHNFPEHLLDHQRVMPSLLKGDEDTAKDPRPVPRILLEGADSVGAWGALARVYLNIGTYHEQWIRLHNPLLGFTPQKPFKIKDCEDNSVFWQVNKERVEYLAKFFLASTAPMRLKDAVGGQTYLNLNGKNEKGETVSGEGVPWDPHLHAGRKVFARRCIICHSSKQPQEIWSKREAEFTKGDVLLDILASDEYQDWAQEAVKDKRFWEDNFLSTDHRVPITVVGTNAARSLATNGIAGQMWEDFSSDTYKHLPSVGAIQVYDPYRKIDVSFQAPGGGRGFYRPASLISIWATAPYLHNNSVGIFNNDPSVKGRMEAFDDGIRKLLVAVDEAQRQGKARAEIQQLAARNRRQMGSDLNGATKDRLEEDHGLIWRTTEDTWIRIPAKNIPGLLKSATGFGSPLLNDFPWLVPALCLALALFFLLLSIRFNPRWRCPGYVFLATTVAASFASYFLAGRLGDLEIGPIPKGTPVNLFANLDPDPAKQAQLIETILEAGSVLQKGRARKLGSEQLRELLQRDVASKLLSLSKCPDLVMDRGHYFAMELTLQELNDLIELLKTF
ncbi:MAG: hypothetical protein HY040_16235 [Planctomycetes bacterium]|nr:hypothetical protein [Planctomycetota bacterium]